MNANIWDGLFQRIGLSSQTPRATPAPDNEVCELARALKRGKEAVSIAFGERAGNDPLIVAEFLKAEAIALAGAQLKGLREIFEGGTGAMTIGIERPPNHE